MLTKICKICKRKKDIIKFSKSPTSRSGFNNACAACCREMFDDTFPKRYLTKQQARKYEV